MDEGYFAGSSAPHAMVDTPQGFTKRKSRSNVGLMEKLPLVGAPKTSHINPGSIIPGNGTKPRIRSATATKSQDKSPVLVRKASMNNHFPEEKDDSVLEKVPSGQTKSLELKQYENYQKLTTPSVRYQKDNESQLLREQHQAQKQRRRAEIYAINARMKEFSQAKIALFIEQQQNANSNVTNVIVAPLGV
ncbi:Aste57867_22551 [Aphanomyces stellatus]|uniref:Aste57867_22551 protein n=1 Tax=Aphanomyces stellatus TaxID=120398 RepID=A0A485LKD0_9STRA|nr:hypothetical protein As57867_022481 [Aphanomyces stellatus]VFT99210.1 Aste57867_22551 [Aphanomyces stellatus]